jgi:hypothetical protein
VDLPKPAGAVSPAGTQVQSPTEVARPRPIRRKQRPPVREIVQPAPVTRTQHEETQFDNTAEQLNAEQLGASPPEPGMAPDTIANELNREELDLPWAMSRAPYHRSTDQY